MKNIYELWYSVVNAGDGSAYPKFFTSKESAQKHQEKGNEDGDGWAEDCSGVAQLIIKDDVIFYTVNEWISGASRHETMEYELSTAPETMDLLKTRFDELIDIERKYQNLIKEK